MADSPTLSSGSLVTFKVFSDGTELEGVVQVISIDVVQEINCVPKAILVIEDGDMPEKDFPVSNKDTFKPGAEIKIDAGYDTEEETIFEGIVINLGIKITGNNYSRLVVECRDKAFAMTVGRKNANYVDKKDSDVITALIGNYSTLSNDVEATTLQYKELVQYYCTDWDFMLSRAEINGLLVIAEAGKVSVKAPQTAGSAALKVTYGQDLMEFHASVDAGSQLSASKGVTWDLKTQKAVEKEGTAPTLNEQGNLTSTDLADVVGLDSFLLQTSAPIDENGLKAWADAQLVKAGLAMICGRMKFQGSAKAKVGELIELEGVGERFTGSVFVSSVKHKFLAGEWTTETGFGMSPDWFAEKRDLVAPPASGLLPGVEGLHIGVVMKLDADPEGEQKVQVSVPVLQAETEGVWARLSNFYSSEGIGAFFIPEIGDEVVLGYFNNDPCHPVILGSLYSSKRKPPYDLTAENYTKAIVTKSELKIEFDDEKKIITVITPGENKIVISDEDKSILLEDQNSNKVELNADGITLDSPKDIKITAKGKITLDATGEIGITSKADVKLTGLNIKNAASAGFEAKGNATAEISASGQTTVKGAMVMIN